jgi:hypothetical protein
MVLELGAVEEAQLQRIVAQLARAGLAAAVSGRKQITVRVQ